jgi:hypothetical protein
LKPSLTPGAHDVSKLTAPSGAVATAGADAGGVRSPWTLS